MEHRFLATFPAVADAVKSGREARGLSQAELAANANVSQDFVASVEAGTPRIELELILQILEALGIHATALPAPPASGITMEDIDLNQVVARFA